MPKAYHRLSLYPERPTWAFQGPPEEAYSRSTDPHRFQPLHPFAWKVIRQIQDVFGITHFSADDPVPSNEALGEIREVIGLAPLHPLCAAITIGFTSFPGLVVHCGHWMVDRFPSCGCDACGETADSEAFRFEDTLLAVIQGSFRERVVLPVIGFAWYQSDLQIEGSRSGSTWRVPRSRARDMIRAHGRQMHWRPWPMS